MSAYDELRRIITDHLTHPQHKDRALILLDAVVTEERRRGAAGPSEGSAGVSGVPSGTQQFVRPNGDIAAAASSFGADPLAGGNGVLGWPSVSPGAGAWSNAGLSDLSLGGSTPVGSWPGAGFNSTGGSWGFGATSVGGSIESDEAAVLTGLALDGPAPGIGGGISWNATPVASFDLVDSNSDSRFGSSFLLPPSAAQQSDPVRGQEEAASEAQQPAAKFSSVVGGTAPPRVQQAQASTPASTSSTTTTEDTTKRVVETHQRREDQSRNETNKRQEPPRLPPAKVEPKRQEPKRIDAAGMGGKAGTTAKVKLRGLPYGATMNDVINFFRGYGMVDGSVTFGVNSDGRPSGEAWVSFTRLEDARRAVREKDRHHMGDRYVELFLLNEGGGVAGRGFK